jgi:predicted RNA-binding protein YlqC (UPF0109 family)
MIMLLRKLLDKPEDLTYENIEEDKKSQSS